MCLNYDIIGNFQSIIYICNIVKFIYQDLYCDKLSMLRDGLP